MRLPLTHIEIFSSRLERYKALHCASDLLNCRVVYQNDSFATDPFLRVLLMKKLLKGDASECKLSSNLLFPSGWVFQGRDKNYGAGEMPRRKYQVFLFKSRHELVKTSDFSMKLLINGNPFAAVEEMSGNNFHHI